MRPIDRGDTPLVKDGDPIIFNKYQESRGFLIERLGSYCSYCERPLAGNTAVEHVQPKSKHHDLELEWDNFLLACINCNSIKGKKDIDLSQYFWPDRDNTLLAFLYNDGARIFPSPLLSAQLKTLAENTISLTGLDRVPSPDPNINPEMTDTRWRERRDTLNIAERAKKRLASNDNESMRATIVDLATASGFFSIWFKVFSQDKNMVLRLLDAFPGTSKSCFSSQGVPINRIDGII